MRAIWILPRIISLDPNIQRYCQPALELYTAHTVWRHTSISIWYAFDLLAGLRGTQLEIILLYHSYVIQTPSPSASPRQTACEKWFPENSNSVRSTKDIDLIIFTSVTSDLFNKLARSAARPPTRRPRHRTLCDNIV